MWNVSKVCTLWHPKSSRKGASFCVKILSDNSPLGPVFKISINNAHIPYKAEFWSSMLDIIRPRDKFNNKWMVI